MARAVRARAGDLIAAALEAQGLEKRALAREQVKAEHPEAKGAARRELVESYRRKLVRWTSDEKPTHAISYKNACWIGPRLGIPVADLIKPELTEDERRLRKAERLEAQARELRGLGDPGQGDGP